MEFSTGSWFPLLCISCKMYYSRKRGIRNNNLFTVYELGTLFLLDFVNRTLSSTRKYQIILQTIDTY